MSDRPSVVDLEEQVRRLEPEQFRSFAAWFEEYQADQWDARIEADFQAGRLDGLRERATRAWREGACTPL